MGVAMRGLMAKGSSFDAHPSQWAPFVVVGDSRRSPAPSAVWHPTGPPVLHLWDRLRFHNAIWHTMVLAASNPSQNEVLELDRVAAG
jgi:hypothetical protein